MTTIQSLTCKLRSVITLGHQSPEFKVVRLLTSNTHMTDSIVYLPERELNSALHKKAKSYRASKEEDQTMQ